MDDIQHHKTQKKQIIFIQKNDLALFTGPLRHTAKYPDLRASRSSSRLSPVRADTPKASA